MPTRRVLKSVAHNLLDSILSGPYVSQEGSLFALLRDAASRAATSHIALDLLARKVEPPAAATAALRTSIAMASDRLLELLGSAKLTPAHVSAARIDVGLHTVSGTVELESVIVRLVDDHQRSHDFHCPAKWWEPPAFMRPGPPPPLIDPPRVETPLTRFLDRLGDMLPRFYEPPPQ